MGDEGGARNVFATLWAGMKRVFTLGLSEVKLPAEVPSNTEELRRLIISYEREGLELKDARLWLKKAEAEPDKAELFITYGFYEANRQRQKKNHGKRALSFFFGAIALFIIYIFLWYVLQSKFLYMKFALFIPSILFVIFLINILRFLSLTTKAELRITEIPKTTDELCPVIVEYEGRGVNVEGAWELYRKAEKIEITTKAEGKLSGESARSLLQRAYADLINKSRRRWPSIIAVWFGVVVVVLTVLSFCVMLKWEEELPIEEVIIGIPIFVIIWGLVGSASYSLVQANYLIRERLMNWYDLVRYFCRIIAGGILAAVVFYIIQLGAVSLPGNVSKEITAALETAEAAENYNAALWLTREYEGQADKDKKVLSEFASVEGRSVNGQYKILLDYQNEWRFAKPSVITEAPEGSLQQIEVTPETLKKAYTYYDNVKRDEDEKFRKELYDKFLPQIKKRKVKQKGEFEVIKNNIDREDAVRDKLLALLLNADMWSPVYNVSGEEVLNSDILINTIEKYDTPNPKISRAKTNFEKQLDAAKNALVSAINKRQADYKDAQKKVRKWRCYFKSETLEKQKERFEKRMNILLEQNKKVLRETTRTEAEIPRPGVIEVEEERAITNQDIEAEIKDVESELSALEIELEKAYLAESARPIWESPLFIVLAFLSGYSVEFASRLIEKIAKSYNNGDGSSPPKPGPKPGSGANAGEVSSTPT